jgi:hypothetical protein
MNILKNNWDSRLEYVVSLFNTSYTINITLKKIRNHIQYLQFFIKNNTNVHVNETLSNPFNSISRTKVYENPKF